MIDHSIHRPTPVAKKRPFAVTPAKPQDVRRLVDIEFHAFENERVNQVLSYRDYKKPAHFERSVKLYKLALHSGSAADRESGRSTRCRSDSKLERQQPTGRVNFKKIVHKDTNEVISFTKFEFKAYTWEELHSLAESGHEGEPRMNKDWFALNERLRRDYVGVEEHCCKSQECRLCVS